MKNLLLLALICSLPLQATDFLSNEGGPYLFSGPYLYDDGIAHQIIAAVRNDPTLSRQAKKSRIDVHSGIVTLKGLVTNEDERARIETIALQTDGVRSVNNELKVIE